MTYNHVICPCEVFWGHLGPFRAKSGPQLPLSQLTCEQDKKSQFWRPDQFSMNNVGHLFLSSLLTPKCTFCAILTHLKMMFLRKSTSLNTQFGPKNAFFGPEGPFWPETSKHSVPSCYIMPKQSITGLKLVSEGKRVIRLPKDPPRDPRAPQSPPGRVQRA